VHTAYIRAAAWRGARPRQKSHLDSRCPAGDIRRARTLVGRPNASGASLAGGHDAANGFLQAWLRREGGCLFITRMRPIRSWRGYVQARGGGGGGEPAPPPVLPAAVMRRLGYVAIGRG